MALASGTRRGAYEILSLIGSGGMGEVYWAKDTKLGRDVALKILPVSFTNDPDRVARFRREAQVLASLNHPHIAQIFGLEETDGTQFLVLELVGGESLDKRIARGPIPIDEALGIAKQIAEALEAAHEKGIIHRDLKPANIALTKEGNVKVLDFGLAKAVEAISGTPSELTQSPTITSPAIMTGVGVILGTAAYMSPEQAKGKAADKRSDVWAFGCVLYEMLTGKRAFQGDDASDSLAAVLRSDPDWNTLPSTLPASIRALVEGSLKKDRRERIADISTAHFLLSHRHLAPAATPVSPPLSWPLWTYATVAIAVGALIGAAAVAGVWKLKPSPAVPVIRFAITLPAGQRLTLSRQAVALSPDGTRIAYVAEGRLFLWSMSELEPKAIVGVGTTTNPVFSPDGQSLAFWADSTLKRISISGGVPVTICRTSGTAPQGIAWDTEGIVFAQSGAGIMRVSPNGGQPEVLLAVSGSEGLAYGPQMLPDGSTLLFTIAPPAAAAGDRWDQARIVAQSLKTGERKVLIEGGTDARYVPTGHLVYALGGTLWAVPFNLARLEVAGGPVPVVEGVQRAASASSAPSGTAHFVFSNAGSLVYVPGPVSAEQQHLFLFDRTGAAEPLKLPPGSYAYPRVSPDGKRLAIETKDGKEATVSIYELSGASAPRRLTFGGNNRFPIWSGDGQHVAFQSDRDGDLAVFWQPVDGGAAERLTKPEAGTSHVPESWSPTGEVLLFSAAKSSATSLWALSVRDRKAMPFDNVRSDSLPTTAAFSPDGRWVAYQTGEAGGPEGTTYVQPFPPNGDKYQIARGGRPLWSRDGKELFYVPGPSQFMAVTVRTQPNFTFSSPVAVPRRFGIASPTSPRTFDITREGRFVGLGTSGQGQGGLSETAQILVVLNWFTELQQRVPTR